MIELSESLLERSPEETCRHLCLALLREADDALSRLTAGEDGEALHDFRVALRRLRSTIGTYRPYLKGSARKKLRARLKALALSTNRARDLEVQVEWLSKAPSGAMAMEPEAERGARFLLERLNARETATLHAAELRERFSGLHRPLEKSLSRLRLRFDEGGPSFLAATGTLIAEKARGLEEGLSSVRSAEDVDALHRARIEAKRLRYLLEPLQARVDGVHALVQEMKALQDLLGDLQDTRVLTETISEELERAAVEEAHRLRDLAFQEGAIFDEGRARAHPGLLALLRAQRDRRDRVYAELSRDWLRPASDPFFHKTSRLAKRLAASSFGPKSRRRFLLSSVPEQARRGAPRFVRQSFLPGRRIHEEVRSTRAGGRSRYLRVTAIEGRSRAEEPISRDLFEALWSAEGGHRLERVRYQIRAKGVLWSIDELPEKNLVLAEVVVDSDGEILPPKWMKPVLLREVTGSRKYEWESLARAKAKAKVKAKAKAKSKVNAGARSAPERSAGPRAGAR